jgi:hypothetical protein
MGNLTTTFNVDEVMRIQLERIRTQEYTALGRLVWISLELQLDHKPTEEETITKGRFDFMHDGPLLAMSRDHADLLLPEGVPLELPEIPLPSWTPPFQTQEQIEAPGWRPQKAPMIKQLWLDPARGGKTFGDGADAWVYFQPVIQVTFRLFDKPTYGFVKCKPSPWGGTRTALLVDPAKGRAFFYGGTFEIGVR